MPRYILKRVLQLIPILFVVSILIFALVRLSPADPIASITKGKQISEETRQGLREQFHLDKSYEQYFIWITALSGGTLGRVTSTGKR